MLRTDVCCFHTSIAVLALALSSAAYGQTVEVLDQPEGLASDSISIGSEQVCIEVRIVSLSEPLLKQLHEELGEQWEMEAVSEGETVTAANVLPDAPRSTSNITLAAFNSQDTSPADFVYSTTSTVQSLPSRVTRLTDGQVKTLIDKVQADAKSNILQAPKVTVFPGQQATIKDTTQRPFVVSAKPVKDGSAVAMQPIVRVFEDGLTIQLCATLRGDDQLEMRSHITFSQIGDVDEFTFQETTVQIPEQHLRQVHVSKVIDDEATLLIDPHFVTEVATPKRFRTFAVSRQYTIVLLTPRIIHD